MVQFSKDRDNEECVIYQQTGHSYIYITDIMSDFKLPFILLLKFQIFLQGKVSTRFNEKGSWD